jgi:4-aminobutyrate aminotransferase-like enzyme
MWGFARYGLVPDLVTLGKPMGNGHPVAAMIGRPELIAAFASRGRYFNTFGGNPVSAAIGLAVLDVIADEGLQEPARVTGERLLAGLRDVAARREAIGDVRGMGLFVGFELVRDRATREPDAALAAELVNRAAERGVLISTDGPDHDVIKIKPPMVFSATDADRLIETVDAILGELARA